MIKKRIIPKLVLGSNHNSNRIISGTSIQYDQVRTTGAPESQANIYQSTISDELMVLISNKFSYQFVDVISTLTRINNEVLMPVSFGGNIKNMNEVELIFETGIEKIVFNRAQYLNPKLIKNTAERFGSQSVVASIDYIESQNQSDVLISYSGKTEIMNFEVLINLAESLGVGEICLNNKSRDGMMKGTDLFYLERARIMTQLPIIQSCGVGKIQHFIDAFNNGADAVAAGTYFSFFDQNLLQVRNHIRNAGIDIRI